MSASFELESPASSKGYNLSFTHARLIPDPQRVLSWEWLKHQVMTINLTNVALLVAVLVVSSSISSQLDQQRAQNELAFQVSGQLAAQLGSAQSAVNTLASANEIGQSLNASINLAISSGLTNLTGQLADQRQSLLASTNQLDNLRLAISNYSSVKFFTPTLYSSDATVTYNDQNPGRSDCTPQGIYFQIGALVVFTFTVSGTVSGSPNPAGHTALSLPVKASNAYTYGYLAQRYNMGADQHIALNTQNSGAGQARVYLVRTDVSNSQTNSQWIMRTGAGLPNYNFCFGGTFVYYTDGT